MARLNKSEWNDSSDSYESIGDNFEVIELADTHEKGVMWSEDLDVILLSVSELKRLADALGYDLVERVVPIHEIDALGRAIYNDACRCEYCNTEGLTDDDSAREDMLWKESLL